MTAPMLEITFQKGRPLAAYLHLSSARRKAGTTRQLAPSLLLTPTLVDRSVGEFARAL